MYYVLCTMYAWVYVYYTTIITIVIKIETNHEKMIIMFINIIIMAYRERLPTRLDPVSDVNGNTWNFAITLDGILKLAHFDISKWIYSKISRLKSDRFKNVHAVYKIISGDYTFYVAQIIVITHNINYEHIKLYQWWLTDEDCFSRSKNKFIWNTTNT